MLFGYSVVIFKEDGGCVGFIDFFTHCTTFTVSAESFDVAINCRPPYIRYFEIAA